MLCAFVAVMDEDDKDDDDDVAAAVLAIDDCDSVIGLLLVELAVLLVLLLDVVGFVIGRRVTDVDLTVDVLVAGLCDDKGFVVVSFLSSPADTTENVVVNSSSS